MTSPFSDAIIAFSAFLTFPLIIMLLDACIAFLRFIFPVKFADPATNIGLFINICSSSTV